MIYYKIPVNYNFLSKSSMSNISNGLETSSRDFSLILLITFLFASSFNFLIITTTFGCVQYDLDDAVRVRDIVYFMPFNIRCDEHPLKTNAHLKRTLFIKSLSAELLFYLDVLVLKVKS